MKPWLSCVLLSAALLYIVGTVGPWLLILAIVWFFILRQMRSPG